MNKSMIASMALFLSPCAPVCAQQADSPYSQGFEKIRVGGYGEMAASFKQYGNQRYTTPTGSSGEHRATISIPRFVLAADYCFSKRWQLGFEVEFESGGTGVAYELENTENGEYETEVEKGGEVALEQFHITFAAFPELNVRVGHQILPVGLTNSHHEPLNFFGVYRPEGECAIMPSTWHETGLSLFGTIGWRKSWEFEYQAMVVAGLNANGFDRTTWVAGGKQGFFEQDNFTSPAYVGRIDYKGVKGLRVGASVYYCRDTGSNADKSQTYAAVGRLPLTIWTVDAQYQCKYVIARGNCVFGHLGNSAALSRKNTSLSNKSPYSRTTPIARRAVSYGAEAGLRIDGFFARCPSLIPFVRYEYYNPQEQVQPPSTPDQRERVSMWTAGVNWRPLPNLVVKADWTTRTIGGGRYRDENEFSIGVAYMAWFWKK